MDGDLLEETQALGAQALCSGALPHCRMFSGGGSHRCRFVNTALIRHLGWLRFLSSKCHDRVHCTYVFS